MDIHFAPLQGYTDNPYRKFHYKLFGGIHTYYTPFIRVEKGEPRHQDINRLKDALCEDYPLRPQIIFNSIEEFNILVEKLKVFGVRKIDLNLGCPYPMQTKRNRGAAAISNITLLSQIAERIGSDDISYSVKMRLGENKPDEWKCIMPVLNEMNLAHIAVHPRVAKQLYKGDIHFDQFKDILKESKNPIIYNGDIITTHDINTTIEKFPEIKGIMIGRGLLARPSLAEEWMSNTPMENDEIIFKAKELHSKILEEYNEKLCGDNQILMKIKPFWDYLESLIGHKMHKAIKKSTSLLKYKDTVNSI